jgi:mannose-6-phosphate isomerase-like protein (cupin superfamily)
VQVSDRFPIEELGLSRGLWRGGAQPSGVQQERRTVRYADQPTLPAGSDREFRYLVNQDVGCLDVTQGVGLIAPGRARAHGHSYDEIVYIIDGGRNHLGGQETVIGRGSAIHLPPLIEHCLENTGKGSMRVLGVFHPSGDPASRASDSQ